MNKHLYREAADKLSTLQMECMDNEQHYLDTNFIFIGRTSFSDILMENEYYAFGRPDELLHIITRALVGDEEMTMIFAAAVAEAIEQQKINNT
jgi:hypothetical protein